MKPLTAMLERTADGAMVVDEEGKIVLWNRVAERLLGFRAKEVVGRFCRDVLRGETLSGRPLCSPSCPIGARVARGGGIRQFDMQTHTKDGRLVWLNVSSLPVPSRKPSTFRVAHLFRDITKQAKVSRLVQELHAAVCPIQVRLPEPCAASMPNIPAALPLSQREREILRRLATGERTADMAVALGITPKTVRNHIQRLLEKLGAHSRLQALAIAFPPNTSLSTSSPR
ncbi:MAG: PAS and helix-turn-helix domain-containing protein [Nitrospirota bacterium]